ncbi:MAG: TIGR03087 family PEP-CTERM/XrtA system glycosyltransferase [Acidimicrobiia bacterium]|nr:TIGR03087 family PEP-CTERM/XrtA system glycosyltransferase [Acidimicrobiia bacterium]
MRVLMLTHRLPYTADRGDRIRSHHLLRFLSAHAEVDLVSLAHDAQEAAHAGAISGLVSSVAAVRTTPVRGCIRALGALATGSPLTHALLDAPGFGAAIRATVERHRPDVVLAYCTGIAHAALAPPLDRIPMVLDMVDVDSEKWRTLGARTAPPLGWVYASEARRLARFEAEAALRAHAVTVVHERERAALERLAPGARVHVVANGIAVDTFRPATAPSPGRRVVFCGVMNYAPNVEAACWLAERVWPLVVRELPDARLCLLGASPARAVRSLAARDATVEVTGRVPDVRPYLWESAVAAAPLQVARGVQNKVLEAVAAGLPCVVTPAVDAGLPAEVRPACRVADEPQTFARSLVALLRLAPEARRDLAAQADLAHLSWTERLAPLLPLLRPAISHSAKRSMPAANDVRGS